MSANSQQINWAEWIKSLIDFRIWDVRNYKQLFVYVLPFGLSEVAFSQRYTIACAVGNSVQVSCFFFGYPHCKVSWIWRKIVGLFCALIKAENVLFRFSQTRIWGLQENHIWYITVEALFRTCVSVRLKMSSELVIKEALLHFLYPVIVVVPDFWMWKFPDDLSLLTVSLPILSSIQAHTFHNLWRSFFASCRFSHHTSTTFWGATSWSSIPEWCGGTVFG